jgi:cytochrome b pre-mRNA-processing protein 3
MSIWPFRRNRANMDAARLLEAVVAASRRPEFYGPGRVPDTLAGRFDLLTLNAALALVRLKASPEAARLAQAFTDRLFRHIDSGLREAGVGDLTVPKKMRKLAGEFYGRLEAYAGALAAPEALSGAIARNILGDQADSAFAGKLGAYVAGVAARQAEFAPEALFEAGAWDCAFP